MNQVSWFPQHIWGEGEPPYKPEYLFVAAELELGDPGPCHRDHECTLSCPDKEIVLVNRLSLFLAKHRVSGITRFIRDWRAWRKAHGP